MADFGSTKYNASFEEWHELLMDYAELRGGSAADAEAWRDDYEAGKTSGMAISLREKRRYRLSGEAVGW
ncbi:hypothetical protein ACOIZ1_002424 [Escherichia coli]